MRLSGVKKVRVVQVIDKTKGPISAQHSDNAVDKNISDLLVIMEYELGSIAKGWIYSRKGKNMMGYRAEMGLGIADMLVCLTKLAEQLDLDIEVLAQQGVNRYAERMKECEEGVI